MNHSIVIAHFHIHDAAHQVKTEPVSNLSALKAEMAKFLESRRKALSKSLYHRSSVRSLLEKAIKAKMKPGDIENHRLDESTEISAPNEMTEPHCPFTSSFPKEEVWEEYIVISVDMTRVSMLQTMEQSPVDSWEPSKLRHFVTPDGSPASSRNITESKDWWDRPLWAWKRNELTLANGAMLAVDLTENLNPILLPSQKLKVTVSNEKKLPERTISGEWSYRIAPFVEAYGDEKTQEMQTESNDLSVSSTCDDNIESVAIEQDISRLDNLSVSGGQTIKLETTSRVEITKKQSPTDLELNDSPVLKQNIQNESRLDDKSELHVEEGSNLHAEGTMPQDFDSNNSSLTGSSITPTIVFGNIPVTLSPEDSVTTTEDESSQKDTTTASRDTKIDLDVADPKRDLLSTSCVSGPKEEPTKSLDAPKSVITTPVKCKFDPTVSHDSRIEYDSGTESSPCDKIEGSQESKTSTPVTASDGMENPLYTSAQPEKPRSITVSPTCTQEIDEEQNVASNDSIPPARGDVVPKSPQLDSQGIDLSMLSQIPQELRSEARLAVAIRQPRKTRKRCRPPKDSHLYKWLSSSSSSASSKVPRTENHALEDRRRPSNIKDFFPVA